jgi:hypothetical protein
MKKLIVLVEIFALAAITVTAITINPQWLQTMVAASRVANGPQETTIGKITAFVQAAGIVVALTVHPQSVEPSSR